MTYDATRNSTLTRTLANVFGDFSDLVRAELRLARAELSENIATAVRASTFLVVAAVLGLFAFAVILEAIIFGLVAYGLPLYGACLIVAAALAVLGLAAFAYGRSAARHDLVPKRSIRHMNEGIQIAKEQLS